MIDAALAAAEQIFTKPFRTVFVKSLGLTLLLLALLWAGIEKLVVSTIHLPYFWLATAVHILAGFGLLVAVTFLVTPVSFIVAGFFFDELAEHAETAVAGADGRGRAMAVAPALWIGAKFAALSLAVNAVALALLLVPGVNAVAFFGANAYLLGRGYFELAALRYRSVEEVRRLRGRHGLRIAVAGCVVAAFLLVPLLNLLTPLFASAFLVRVAQPIVGRGAAGQAIR